MGYCNSVIMGKSLNIDWYTTNDEWIWYDIVICKITLNILVNTWHEKDINHGMSLWLVNSISTRWPHAVAKNMSLIQILHAFVDRQHVCNLQVSKPAIPLLVQFHPHGWNPVALWETVLATLFAAVNVNPGFIDPAYQLGVLQQK